MNKFILFTTFAALMGGAAHAQATCPPGVQSCNIAEIGDREYDNSQSLGDTLNNTYAPDSANANANIDADLKAIAQGGSADSSATGNVSTNNNQSSANNAATNNMTNGNISNDVSGGNINTEGGNITGGNLAQNGSADINNSGGNVTGGNALTNAGNINSAGGAGGSVGSVKSGSKSSAVTGASTSKATGGSVSGSGNSRSASRSGVSGSGNSSNRNSTGNQTTNVDALQRIKHAANTAASVFMPGYGPQNCFGDTNPSGAFGASIQTFGWGVTANRSKASNICAATQLMGRNGGIVYGAQLGDPAFRSAAIALGYVETPSMNRERVKLQATALARIEEIRSGVFAVPAKGRPFASCRYADGQVFVKPRSKSASQAARAECVALINMSRAEAGKAYVRVTAPTAKKTSGLPAGYSCPATHPVFVEGKGCRK